MVARCWTLESDGVGEGDLERVKRGGVEISELVEMDLVSSSDG